MTRTSIRLVVLVSTLIAAGSVAAAADAWAQDTLRLPALEAAAMRRDPRA
ncbi:MAG: hypothetical protein JWM27_3764, partial [Gemmatimonadetes bacterium]|nr:hypothetical protein [Gemmatimonadota bacterium]